MLPLLSTPDRLPTFIPSVPLARRAATNAVSATRTCKDIVVVLPFVLVVLGTIGVAATYGHKVKSATTVPSLQDVSGATFLLHIIGLSALASSCLSLLCLLGTLWLAKGFMWVTGTIMLGLHVAAATILTNEMADRKVDAGWWPALGFGLLALVATGYLGCLRKRMEFATVHLQVAAMAVYQLPMVVIVAFLLTIVHSGWTLLWVLGTLGVMFHHDWIKLLTSCTTATCTVEYDIFAIIAVSSGMVLIYLWATFVLRNIIGVTTAGSVAAWKNANATPCITIRAWARAVTLNLGSICLGSLIVAVLETTVWMLRSVAWLARHKGNCCLACLVACLSCVILGIEKWVEYFNRFAFSYIGCYGYTFRTASRYTFHLLASKGWSAIVNNDLTGTILWQCNIIVGSGTACLGVHIADTTDVARLAMFPYPRVVVAVVCFFVGYGINNIVMAVVASAITTIFVLWAEDPHGWQHTRPTQYEMLHKAWRTIYPDEYNNGYGKHEV